jgi:hypothetical protein
MIFKYGVSIETFRQGLISILETGLFDQGFDELPTTPAFLDRVLPLHGARSVRVLLRIDQFPGPLLFGVLGPDFVVMLYPGIDILRGADIITAVLEAAQDVDENRHTQTIKGIDPRGQPF